jgi:hypothetical protein
MFFTTLFILFHFLSLSLSLLASLFLSLNFSLFLYPYYLSFSLYYVLLVLD